MTPQTGLTLSRNTLSLTRLRSAAGAPAGPVGGEAASWTADVSISLGSQRSITTTDGALNYETEIVRDSIYSVQASDTQFKTSEPGNYLVRYDFGIRNNPNVGTPTRAAVRGTLRVNGSTLVAGRSQAYWRNIQACNNAAAAGGAIVPLAADDYVSVFAQRVDTAGTGGNTVRRGNSDGSLSLWRLRSNWPIARARSDSDGSALNNSGLPVYTFDEIEQLDDGWGDSGSVGGSTSEFVFDPTAAGFDGAEPFLFLVCIGIEGERGGTGEALFFGQVQYDTDEGGINYEARSGLTSFAEGVSAIDLAVLSAVVPIRHAPEGDTVARLRVRIDCINAGSASITPKGGRVAIQIVAIPESELDFFMAHQETPGQAADVDVDLDFPNSNQVGASFSFDSGADPSLVTVSGDVWALYLSGFASGGNTGPRSANRINHETKPNRNAGTIAEYGHGWAHNRGGVLEFSGASGHTILAAADGDTFEVRLDKTNNQTDANLDIIGSGSLEANYFCLIKLRDAP